MKEFLWIIIACVIDSLVALIGVISLWFSKVALNKIVKYLVAFATGALLGGAFFHLLSESLNELSYFTSSSFLMIGFVLFFVTEKFLHWHHCEENGKCKLRKRKSFVELILIGDGLHNFIDGLIIAASFLVNMPFGIVTTLLIISHEVPQEIGDFGILVYGGLKRKTALFWNFISQLTCVLGGIAGYFVSEAYNVSIYLLPFAAGGFIYIAAADLIPELYKEKEMSFKTIFIFLLGIFIMFFMKLLIK